MKGNVSHRADPRNAYTPQLQLLTEQLGQDVHRNEWRVNLLMETFFSASMLEKMVRRRNGPLKSKWDIVKGRSSEDRSMISIHDSLRLWCIQSKSTAFHKTWDASYAPTMQQLIGFWFILNYNSNLTDTISTDGARSATVAQMIPHPIPRQLFLWDQLSNVIASATTMLRCEKRSEKSNPYQSVCWRYDWYRTSRNRQGLMLRLRLRFRGYCFWKIFSKSRNRCYSVMDGRVYENLAKCLPCLQ